MRHIVLVAWLGACGASTPPGPGPASTKPSTRCPGTYAETAALGSCPDDVGAECAFPEGICHCGSRSFCGGAEPPPEVYAELEKPVWQCDPIRTDGCPETATGPCDEEGKACQYGDCCIMVATCTGGTWVPGQESCPP